MDFTTISRSYSLDFVIENVMRNDFVFLYKLELYVTYMYIFGIYYN